MRWIRSRHRFQCGWLLTCAASDPDEPPYSTCLHWRLELGYPAARVLRGNLSGTNACLASMPPVSPAPASPTAAPVPPASAAPVPLGFSGGLLDQLHAALGALPGCVFHYLRVHRTSILRSLCLVGGHHRSSAWNCGEYRDYESGDKYGGHDVRDHIFHVIRLFVVVLVAVG